LAFEKLYEIAGDQYAITSIFASKPPARDDTCLAKKLFLYNRVVQYGIMV
jgi:hypothetical protein